MDRTDFLGNWQETLRQVIGEEMRKVFFGLLLTLLGCANLSAQSQQGVGYVVAIDGSAQLLRDGKTAELQLGEPILRGDQVLATPPNFVRIDTAVGAVEICGPRKTDAECKHLFRDGRTFLWDGVFWDRTKTMVSWFRQAPRNLVTRSSEPPTLFVGRGTKQKISNKHKNIEIEWLNGTPPFNASLSLDGRSISSRTTSANKVHFAGLELSNGLLVFEVRDAQNRKLTINMTVVETTPTPPDFSQRSVNREHQTLQQITWLSVQENGAWLIESYLTLNSIAANNSFARSMQLSLVHGDRP